MAMPTGTGALSFEQQFVKQQRQQNEKVVRTQISLTQFAKPGF